MNKKTVYICHAALIAALYVVLTYLAEFMGLAKGVIQVRFSEALCILPYFTPAAIPGVTIGCLIFNLLCGAGPLDIIFGTLATLLGALGTYALRRYKWRASLPPILSNTIIIPLVLHFSGMSEDGIPFMMLTVGAGEVISCGILGMMLLFAVEKYMPSLFFNNEKTTA